MSTIGSLRRSSSLRSRGQHERRRRSQAGFTLLEMMVALVAGLIAISSIYYVSSAAARHFHEQQRIAQSQMSLRMAMEQLRRDFGRAALMGSPSSILEKTCPTIAPPPVTIQGIQVFDGAYSSRLDLPSVNNVQADRVLLAGNYVTSDSYELRITDASGRTLFLRQDRQAFRRTFDDLSGAYVPAAFTEVFRVGRMLHVRNQAGYHFFVNITGVNSGSASITINPAINPASSCRQGQGMGGLQRGTMIAPLNRIEYAVLNEDTASSLATLDNSASPLVGVRGPVLIRREVRFDGSATPVAGTERVITEYPAEFNVDLVVDQTVAPGVPPNLVIFTGSNATSVSAPNGRPYAIRSVLVDLSVRSSTEDSRFPFVPRVGRPLTRYELDTTQRGAARVRTEHAEIALPNLVYRGLR